MMAVNTTRLGIECLHLAVQKEGGVGDPEHSVFMRTKYGSES
jgi:hypothetical protein